MTKEDNETIVDQLSYDWHKLELADVAKEYFNQGEQGFPHAQKSLELLLQDIGLSDPGIVKTITDPEVIQKTIENELEVYREGYKTQTVEDMLKYHQGSLEKYLGENTSKVREELKPFLDTKYTEIMQEIITARHTLEGKKKGVKTSEEQVKSAEETMKKYEKVFMTVSLLEQQKKSELRNRVEDAYVRDTFRELYLSEPKENTE